MDFVSGFPVRYESVLDVFSAFEARHVEFMHHFPPSSSLYYDPRLIRSMRADMVSTIVHE